MSSTENPENASLSLNTVHLHSRGLCVMPRLHRPRQSGANARGVDAVPVVVLLPRPVVAQLNGLDADGAQPDGPLERRYDVRGGRALEIRLDDEDILARDGVAQTFRVEWPRRVRVKHRDVEVGRGLKGRLEHGADRENGRCRWIATAQYLDALLDVRLVVLRL